jgi:hypothetical protein
MKDTGTNSPSTENAEMFNHRFRVDVFALAIDAPAGSTVVGTVNIPLPTALAAGTYMMNWLLFLRNPFGIGTLLERAGVFTTLT